MTTGRVHAHRADNVNRPEFVEGRCRDSPLTLASTSTFAPNLRGISPYHLTHSVFSTHHTDWPTSRAGGFDSSLRPLPFGEAAKEERVMSYFVLLSPSGERPPSHHGGEQ